MMNMLTAARRDGQGLVAPGLFPPSARSLFRSGAGFTLIEVLVALVIISVGVLGVTAMQTASINGELMSRNLDTAFNVVSDAFDRMQMNAENITDYNKNNYSQPFVVTVTATNPNPPTSSSEKPTGVIAAADYDAIYHNMYDMKMSSGVLTIQLTNDSPVTGVDTADAVLSWNYKGKTKRCSISTVIIKDKSVMN